MERVVVVVASLALCDRVTHGGCSTVVTAAVPRRLDPHAEALRGGRALRGCCAA